MCSNVQNKINKRLFGTAHVVCRFVSLNLWRVFADRYGIAHICMLSDCRTAPNVRARLWRGKIYHCLIDKDGLTVVSGHNHDESVVYPVLAFTDPAAERPRVA